jgi:hypothetical protein
MLVSAANSLKANRSGVCQGSSYLADTYHNTCWFYLVTSPLGKTMTKPDVGGAGGDLRTDCLAGGAYGRQGHLCFHELNISAH